jgi:peptidoglycan/xylan/chitin deacetylase (PgdA/CDA1 family)
VADSRQKKEEDRMPNSSVALTFDFDALSVWFGYPNTTPAMLARGEYGARVGVPRVLALLRSAGLLATFFIPGHTIDSFPAQVAAILEAGHEVAHHSYAHVDPSAQTPDEERRDMERGLSALQHIGVRPLGYRSPSADMSAVTLALLEEYHFQYDSSLMAGDFQPYRPRIGDRVSQQEPLVAGRAARLWELPIAFEFDDWVHFQFNFNPYRNGTSAPSKVLEIWTADFDWMHANLDGGLLTVAMHPQVIGRGHRIAMLAQFLAHCRQHHDVAFVRLGDIAAALGPLAS